MRVENNCHFEDKVLTYKNEKGESEEAAHINKEGSFVFTHIPKDPAGTFKLQGNANDPSLYAIKIIEKNHNETQLQFQDGKPFPLAYLNFIDANGVLVEKSCLSKDGSFHFDRIDTADRGTFKLEGDSKDPALIKLQVVASNQEIQAIAFSKDSIVRIDKIIDKVPVSPLSSKDAVKLTTLKNQLIAESNPVLKRKIAKQVLAFEAKQEKPVAPPVKPVVSRATNAITKEQIKKEVLAAIARTSTVHASVPKETPVPASSSTNNNSLGDTLVTPPIASNFENILFEFASCHLSSVYTSELKQVADVLKANRKLQLELDGHTDNVGNESYNLKLSARRVHTVEAYLQNRGISSKRIKTRNMGKDYPLEPNQHPDGSDNPEGRKKNRRVEIKLLNDSTK